MTALATRDEISLAIMPNGGGFLCQIVKADDFRKTLSSVTDASIDAMRVACEIDCSARFRSFRCTAVSDNGTNPTSKVMLK